MRATPSWNIFKLIVDKRRGVENSLDEFDRDKKMEVGRKNSRIDRNGKNVLNMEG